MPSALRTASTRTRPSLRGVLACALFLGCTEVNPDYKPRSADADQRPGAGDAGRDFGAGGNLGLDAASGGARGTEGVGGRIGSEAGGASGSGGGGAGGTAGSGGAVGAGGAGGAIDTGGASGGGGSGAGGGLGGSGLGGTGAGGAGGSVVDAMVDGVGVPSATCGNRIANLATITNARGIAVDFSGTVFYTRQEGGEGFIARMAPGAAPELRWWSLGVGGQGRILRVDEKRNIVIATDVNPPGAVIAVYKNAAKPVLMAGIRDISGPHGLAVNDDGVVFISQADGHITRWRPDSPNLDRTIATLTPVFVGQRALGLAFGPGGYLYIGSSNGRIKRLQLMGNTLFAGVDYGGFVGAAHDLAFDVDGRLYISDQTTATARPLGSIPPSGVGFDMVATVAGRFSGFAFGRGMLACQDLYITDLGGPAIRYVAPKRGRDIP